MSNLLYLPKLGVNMTDALIVRWMVKKGNTVK